VSYQLINMSRESFFLTQGVEPLLLKQLNFVNLLNMKQILIIQVKASKSTIYSKKFTFRTCNNMTKTIVFTLQE